VILLDTCAVIWDALDSAQLTKRALDSIERHADELLICDISLWEIAMLMRKGRLQVEAPAAEFLRLVLDARSYRVLPITPEIAERSTGFGSALSADPADRLIAATAVQMNAPVVTADRNLRDCGLIETVW
jgi:PIN domain nuclease of toxin-antitoxin system